MIREVDAGSPAEVAGIKDGEILVKVNGEFVDILSHDEVVGKVRESGKRVSFTTMTLEGLYFYTKVGEFDRSGILQYFLICCLVIQSLKDNSVIVLKKTACISDILCTGFLF